MDKIKAALVQGVSGIAAAAAAYGLSVFHSGVACLQSAYADVAAHLPAVAGQVDSLSAHAAAQSASDPSFFVVAAVFAAISAGIGALARKLPIWG